MYIHPMTCTRFLAEHLGLTLALNVPVFIVVTKIDMAPPNVLADTLKVLFAVWGHS
jgi:GTPase